MCTETEFNHFPLSGLPLLILKFEEGESDIIKVPMEKLLKPYDKEYMKMAMLKHQEIFKHQVHELHRLYQIQKFLMKNIENRRPNGSKNQERYWNSIHQNLNQNQRPGIDLEQPPEECIAESEGDGELEIEDESEIKLTLGPTNYSRRKKAETPRSSVSGLSFSSSSSSRGEELLKGHNWTRTNSFGVEEELRIDRLKQHPWFFQALSLNMT